MRELKLHRTTTRPRRDLAPRIGYTFARVDEHRIHGDSPETALLFEEHCHQFQLPASAARGHPIREHEQGVHVWVFERELCGLDGFLGALLVVLPTRKLLGKGLK